MNSKAYPNIIIYKTIILYFRSNCNFPNCCIFINKKFIIFYCYFFCFFTERFKNSRFYFILYISRTIIIIVFKNYWTNSFNKFFISVRLMKCSKCNTTFFFQFIISMQYFFILFRLYIFDIFIFAYRHCVIDSVVSFSSPWRTI